MTVINKNLYPTSYSQTGEDVFLLFLIQALGFTSFSWLDIGAHHPLFLSNTALFYEKGYRGINIEGDPELIKAFYQYRPEDINLNILANNSSEDCTFYILNPPTLNTLSKEEALRSQQMGYQITKEVILKSLTIPEIINKYNNGIFPEFLNLDAEGHDFKILKTIEWEKAIPKIICIEIAEHSPKIKDNFNYMVNNEITAYLFDKNYFIVAYTGNNTIFVHKSLT